MKIIKITAAMLVAALIIAVFCSCTEDRSGYMLNNCSKDGVKELLEESPELKALGFTEKNCYNITPDGFNGIKLFKSSMNAHTLIKYPDYSYAELDTSDKPGLISAVLCDLNGNGYYDDVLYTYADDTTKEYGIGVYNGVYGSYATVFKSSGSMYLYLVKQESDIGMPDVYSVLSVAVTQFKDNPADLGCAAIGSVGVVTVSDGMPVFSPDNRSDVKISELKFDNISRVIVSTVDKTQNYTEKSDIERITSFLADVKTEKTDAAPSNNSVNYIVAVVYEDGSVSYAYINDGGFFKLHGEEWRKINGEYQLPF